MDASKPNASSDGGTISWSTEAVLAAGIVTGSMISRMRNPRMGMLLAAGALAWRAMKPRQRPALMLAPPRVLVPEEPVECLAPAPVAPSAPMIEAIVCEEMVAPVIETAAAEMTPVASLPEDTMALPPGMDLNLLTIEDDFNALSEGLRSSEGDDAWILGLEPLPVVEELPMNAAFAAAIVSDPLVHDHRPLIAEGAPLPDMIEISVEPAPEGLQMTRAPFSSAPRSLVVNEGPIEPALSAPVVPDDAPLVVPSSVEMGALALFEGFVPAASVDHLAGIAAVEPAEPVKPIREWAGFEVTPPEAEQPSDSITLRPMPRVMASSESSVSPRRNAVFGMPLPLASVKAAPQEEAPATEPPRRIIPHAPASTAPDDQQKSWLNWWK